MLIAVLASLLSGGWAFAHNASPELHHWEMASHDPDRIFLTFYGDPATSRAVTWRTSPYEGPALAQIARATADPMFSNAAITFTAKTEAVDLALHRKNLQGEVHYHSVVFEGLEPETLYAYRVGRRGHWSEWIQFRTASKEPQSFSFVYFGDAQNDILSKWSRLIRMSYKIAPGARFAIHAGDLVDDGHLDRQWAEWFKAGGWIHSQRTGIPVTGNHEYRHIPGVSKDKVISMIWRPQFTLPEVPSLPDVLQETVYTIDYQGVRIIALNSRVDPKSQAEYLRRELERPGARWTVLTSHYSFFSPRKGRKPTQSAKLWLPIVEEFGVDLVLQGHDHAYARGHQPLREEGGEENSSFETLFVTSVSGPKQYEVSQEKLEGFVSEGYAVGLTAEQRQFFQVIEVDGNQLTYTAYTADGVVFDKVIIRKDPQTGRKEQILVNQE